MENLNIPVFRALIMSTENEYVIGHYAGEDVFGHNIVDVESGISINIDISTLSIHFTYMKASDSTRHMENGQKDLRIFASLSEDGKGGDIDLTEARKYLKLAADQGKADGSRPDNSIMPKPLRRSA